MMMINRYLIIPLLLFLVLVTGCTEDVRIKREPVRGNQNYLTLKNIYFDSTLFEDLRYPANTIKLSGSPKDADFKPVLNNKVALEFVAGQERESFLSMQFPHKRKVNSTIYPHFHWLPEDDTEGYVSWCIDTQCANIGESFTTDTTYCVNDTNNGNSNTHLMTPQIEINNNYAESAMCIIRLWRDGASDTYTGNAYLLEFDIHYIIGQMGEEYDI